MMNEEQLRAQLDAIYASTSWRITAPFRWLVRLPRKTVEKLTLLKMSPKKHENTESKEQEVTLEKLYLTEDAKKILSELQRNIQNQK